MEKNHIIGFILLFSTLFVWSYLNKPSEEEMAKHQRMQDSIANIQIAAESLDQTAAAEVVTPVPAVQLPDSVRLAQNAGLFGPFASASVGTAKDFTLENDKVIVTFSSKGGKVTSVKLKEYTKRIYKRGEETIEEQIVLLSDERNKFEYLLPIASAPSGFVSTEDLYFNGSQSGNKITFTAQASTGGSFKQIYTLDEGYNLDYNIDYAGLDKVFNANNRLQLGKLLARL
jgi:YidC/Oxa1 family membrane protein insertase